VKPLENEFTWSSSRDGTFQRCPRLYWWSYYGSWGGWDRSAPSEAREAYVLKNLSTRWAWVGSAVHGAIESVLRRLQREAQGGDLAFEKAAEMVPEVEVEALTQRMRDQFRESREGHYRSRPKKAFGLMEHEYADPITGAEWKAMSEKAREALRGFFASDIFARLKASDPRLWLPIETLGRFDFEGTPVWAVLDFAQKTPEGGVEIYDWKTGVVDPAGNRAQLVAYALFVKSEHGVPPERTTTRLVYLGPKTEVHDVTVGPADIAEVSAAMRTSIGGMRAKLKDPAKNVAQRDDFPMTDDLEKCRICTFRRLCHR
jgi:RecB family exonuclease